MLINFADKAVLGLAAKPIMHDLGLSPSEYGLLSSGVYILYGIAAIVVGFLSTRFATKWILLVMAIVWALTMLPMAWPVGFAVLLASRMILGAAEGPANPIGMHAAHKWFPNEKRNLPSALLNVGAGVGVVVAAPLLTTVIITYGWHWAFASLFVVGIVWAVLWLLLGKEGTVAGTASTHQPQTPHSHVDEPHVPYRRILLSGTWLAATFASFVAYWALALLISWLPAYLETVLGYSARATGTLIVLPWAVNALLILGQGVLTQRLMRRGVSSRLARGVLGGIVVVIAGIGMLLFPSAIGWFQIAMITVAFSFGGIVLTIGSTVTGEISPTRQRGAILSIYAAVATLAGVIAPYVTGRIIEAAATPTAGYTIAFTIAGVLLLLGGLPALLFVRPERDARRFGLRAAGPVAHQ
ncbi:MAG: MFS transporter [Sciscionella sp.]